MSKHEGSSGAEIRPQSIEAICRVRNELHSVQVGLNLLRQEMRSGDLEGADRTYAVMERCLNRLADDELLRSTTA